MAEPTLKDVLKAIGDLRGQMAANGGKVDDLRSDVEAHRADTRALGAMIEALRTETKNGFEDLDKQLTGHAALHREIEKDIEALKQRPARTTARAPRRPRTR